MMTNRWKLWLGASALAMASGALPVAPVLSPMTTGTLGIDLGNSAWAQDSDESGEGAATDCAATEDGEGDEGGTTDCPPSDESSSGEDGEGG